MAGTLTYSVPEAAVLLGISRSAAYAAAQRGELSAVRVGRLVRIPKRALLRLLDADDGVAASDGAG